MQNFGGQIRCIMGNVEVALRSSENVMKFVKCVCCDGDSREIPGKCDPFSQFLTSVRILLHRVFPLQLISARFLLISQVQRN